VFVVVQHQVQMPFRCGRRPLMLLVSRVA
jgi:hypothetical protein